MEYQKPDYSMSFDDDQGQVVSTGATPSADSLNELTKKVLSSLNPAPVIDDVPDTWVRLPAGLVADDTVYTEAEVQELTGEHEELLAKARTSNNPAKYVNTLLQCGVVAIGGKPVNNNTLNSLLQGDLDMLILGIRRATFGDEFELFDVQCPNCGETNDLKLDLKDIPVKELEDREERQFEVPLRKGRVAVVQFPDGSVQNDIFKKPLSVPEMNSITLASCVISIREANGSEKFSAGLSDVKKLGLADRNTLQNFIYESQPGPRYDQVTAQCHACEGEVPVPLNVGILFRDL